MHVSLHVSLFQDDYFWSSRKHEGSAHVLHRQSPLLRLSPLHRSGSSFSLKTSYSLLRIGVIVCRAYLSLQCLPDTWFELQSLHIVFWVCNVVMWVCLYHASTIDPGFLPRNVPEYDRAIKEVERLVKVILCCCMIVLERKYVTLCRYFDGRWLIMTSGSKARTRSRVCVTPVAR